jgi:integrase
LQPDALESGASRQRDQSTQQGEMRLDARKYINRVFEPALEKAGTEGFRWHDLRHSFASRLVMADVGP